MMKYASANYASPHAELKLTYQLLQKKITNKSFINFIYKSRIFSKDHISLNNRLLYKRTSFAYY